MANETTCPGCKQPYLYDLMTGAVLCCPEHFLVRNGIRKIDGPPQISIEDHEPSANEYCGYMSTADRKVPCRNPVAFVVWGNGWRIVCCPEHITSAHETAILYRNVSL